MSNRKQELRPWHACTLEDVFKSLGSSPEGLVETEVQRRRAEFGPNLLPEKGPTPLWLIVARQFASPLIYILVIAAVVSLIIGDIKDAGFIAVVLVLNAAIGAYQESQAEKSSHALRKLLRMHALVERDGEVREVMAEELVPGDIVWLESGNRVAADMRLLSTQGVEIDESLLTGESLAVTKDAQWTGPAEATLADRHNMAFAGSMVARGRAKGIIVATGLATHVGQLALDVLTGDAGKPPLLSRMERFTNQVAIGTVVASLLIGAIGMLMWKHTLVDTFFLVIALAVAAIPEGLPVAMTVALAVATSRMAERNVIVRRLTAVEGLGSCTLIATDKTGTLTCNELTIREVKLASGRFFQVTGEGFAPSGQVLLNGSPVDIGADDDLQALITAGVLCNEADLHQRDGSWTWSGDAVDIAILSLGHKAGQQRALCLEQYPQVGEIPFESEQQFAASFHRHGSRTLVFVKGAPERVLDMCSAEFS